MDARWNPGGGADLVVNFEDDLGAFLNCHSRYWNAWSALIVGGHQKLITGDDADGLRLGTATAFLFRGVELLDAAKASQDPPLRPGADLLMRAAIEVALRGRYLVVGADRDDEFARLLGDYLDRGEKLAKTVGTTFGGVAPWVLQVVPPSTKPPCVPTDPLDEYASHPRSRSEPKVAVA